jgi:hypothetical protein
MRTHTPRQSSLCACVPYLTAYDDSQGKAPCSLNIDTSRRSVVGFMPRQFSLVTGTASFRSVWRPQNCCTRNTEIKPLPTRKLTPKIKSIARHVTDICHMTIYIGKYKFCILRFEVLTALSVMLFWVLTPYKFAGRYQRSRKTCRLHLPQSNGGARSGTI